MLSRYLHALGRNVFCATLFLTSIILSQAQSNCPYLLDARALIGDLQQSGQNVYGTNPSYITWNGASGTARTECSSFVSLLWEHTFGWTSSTFTAWMGSSSPTAAQYHDTIVAQNGFLQIGNVNLIQPGDLIAIKYPTGGSATGHVMIVAAVPASYRASAPLVVGTTQMTISVVDSSSSYHGPTDTRIQPGGTGEGIGQGIFRFYVNSTGTIIGYTWSTYSNSVFYNQSQRNLIVGRLN